MSKPQEAIANFQMLWANPAASKLHTPKQKHLFMVQIGAPHSDQFGGPTGFYMADQIGSDPPQEDIIDEVTRGYLWYAKSVTKPKITFAKDSDLDGVISGPDARFSVELTETPSYGSITLTLIDPSSPNATRKLLRILRRAGWGGDIQSEPTLRVLDQQDFNEMLSPFIITQYSHIPGSAPGALYKAEEWKLHHPVIANVDFGSLDYSSDDLVEITLEIAYEGFSCTMFDNANDETEFTYVSDQDVRNKIPGRTGG